MNNNSTTYELEQAIDAALAPLRASDARGWSGSVGERIASRALAERRAVLARRALQFWRPLFGAASAAAILACVWTPFAAHTAHDTGSEDGLILSLDAWVSALDEAGAALEADGGPLYELDEATELDLLLESLDGALRLES